VKNPKGSILCFVGPPGVARRSLGNRSPGPPVASCAGVARWVSDEAENSCPSRTNIGALPASNSDDEKAGTVNPVLLLDEVDKLGADFRGDPSSALLESRSRTEPYLQDHYLDVEYDLSKVSS